jgi:N4-gp56 family major capsid protein
MAQSYNDPIGGSNSSIGGQLRTDYFYKKALIEAKKEQYFSQLADVTAMPKHMGKTIKLFHYMPLLDDRNVNDQGIDANGVAIADGNLYGSSKDIGTIAGKMPALSENGGRVNRVGFKRLELEGSIEKFGFFDEYTQESLDFDSDAELEMHVAREMVNGASEITEDALQIDLLNGAGVVRYAGAATSNATVGEADVVTYDDLMRLAIDLDNNRTPKGTKVITGTRLVDTKTIAAARIIYVGSELLPTLRAMTDLHGNPAFVPVQQYAAGGNTVTGEVGSIDQFRIVVVPEMMKWAGEGDVASAGTSYETNGNVDVFPMLVVGDGSFTTIGFQTDGKSVKFKITHKKPGEATADRNDPYGETGFMSIKWYYGSLILRPERLAVVKTAAVL